MVLLLIFFNALVEKCLEDVFLQLWLRFGHQLCVYFVDQKFGTRNYKSINCFNDIIIKPINLVWVREHVHVKGIMSPETILGQSTRLLE